MNLIVTQEGESTVVCGVHSHEIYVAKMDVNMILKNKKKPSQ
jgi:hypothetical protein